MLTEFELKTIRLRAQWGTTATPSPWTMRYREPHWLAVYKGKQVVAKFPERPTHKDGFLVLGKAIDAGMEGRALRELIRAINLIVDVTQGSTAPAFETKT